MIHSHINMYTYIYIYVYIIYKFNARKFVYAFQLFIFSELKKECLGLGAFLHFGWLRSSPMYQMRWIDHMNDSEYLQYIILHIYILYYIMYILHIYIYIIILYYIIYIDSCPCISLHLFATNVESIKNHPQQSPAYGCYVSPSHGRWQPGVPTENSWMTMNQYLYPLVNKHSYWAIENGHRHSWFTQ